VHQHEPAPSPSGQARPRLEIADIFRLHGEVYRQKHSLLPEQRDAMRAIEICRTDVLGGHLDVCDACGLVRPAYNSCRNRHCPKCQALAQALWIEKRMERVLPTHSFHVVFTLPHEIGPLALSNRRIIFDLLFSSASRTLVELGRDEQRLGALLGVTAVLHTWTQDLRFHPHAHCVVTGGGLATAGDRWISTRPKHLFPVRVMSALFRGKFLDALARVYEQGKLDLNGACGDLADRERFHRFKDELYRKPWVVYAKRPFAGPEQVFKYLGRYTHRVAISNHRLLSFDEHDVSFRRKDGSQVTVSVEEFIRRFLLHILPDGFVKIRHYGLLASSNVRTKLEAARRHLKAEDKPTEENRAEPTWQERLLALTGFDVTRCPRCGGRMVPEPLPSLPSTTSASSPTFLDSS
jgi:putative transposase/transposase-like zinc-binding protein